MKLNMTIAAATVLAASLVTPAFAQTSGADIYKSKCQMCHLADGSGNKGMKVTAFSKSSTEAQLTLATKNGASNGSMKMQGYAGKLTDDQIKAVVTYIKTLAK